MNDTMITRHKLHLYQYFNADHSDWNLYATPMEKAGMTDWDWMLIDRLVQDVLLDERGELSETAHDSLEERLEKHCDSADTVEEVKRVAYVNYN